MNSKLRHIFNERAQVYNCATEVFESKGMTLLEVEGLRGKNYFTLACYNDHLFIRMDPEFDNPFNKIINSANWKPIDIIRSLQELYASTDRYLKKTYCYYYYLKDDLLVNHSDLSIEMMTDNKTEQLKTFLNRLTEEELELADIELDQLDPVIFGGFVDDKMVGYISHRYPKGSKNIGDIGIVVDVEYRGKGYGKAMLIHEVNWCLNNDIIPMYVVLEDNVKSNNLVKSLGFKKITDIYRLK